MTAAEAFADWIARGLAHQREGRPADAIPCFRRAAREDPGSPLPGFHLGVVFWQLGLAAEALTAWRSSAQLGPQFVPPRLALAEAALDQRDFASAGQFAGEALAISPNDARARTTALVATAAQGDQAALGKAVQALAEDPAFRASPVFAAAVALALEQADADAVPDAVAALAPFVLELPPRLLAAIAERGAALPAALAQRRWPLADNDALRRIAVAAYAHDRQLAAALANACCALASAQAPPPVPLLWPRRTAGRALRLAWLCPGADASAWARWVAMLTGEATLTSPQFEHALLTTAHSSDARVRLAATPLANAPRLELPQRLDQDAAKAIALHDFDILIDVAGMPLPSADFLAARPARAIWALAAGLPAHGAPLVEREFVDGPTLTGALAELGASPPPATSLGAGELAALWDEAVRRHREGNLEGAAAGYTQVLAQQPDFAPALHLAAALARDRGETEAAMDGLTAAVRAAPTYVAARLAAAELALTRKDAPTAVRLALEGLQRLPHDASLWQMKGLGELARRDGVAAEEAFREHLLRSPANAEGHYNHGVALQMRGESQAAARAYQRALTFRPELVAADFNLGVLFAQAGNHNAAAAAYRTVLAADPGRVAAYKNLGEALFAAGQIDAWIANFRRFEAQCPKALPLAVQALEVCQHLGDFSAIERYLDGLRRETFRARDENELVDSLEELLYLLLFFDIEPEMFSRFAHTYDSTAASVYGRPLPRPPVRRPGRLRLGYLSADLRNHVMGKMIWQAIEHHDRESFDLYFYSASPASDDWTARFRGVASRFESIAALDDQAAVARIDEDDLDILVDLSTHTRGARPGILARKPARVQITHVASAGTVGLSAIDFKLTDRDADLPENQEFQIERLLAMEGCVFPWRCVDPAPSHPFHRGALGIPGDAVVIGAFVSPLKLSRRCLALWRDVLNAIPRARLAFSPAQPAARASYVRLAVAAGIGEDRLLFIPQGRDDAENQARYHLIDLVLDTMPFGGVNGTMEALGMRIPVVTLVGKRHGERTTYSILRNLGVGQTIAQSGREFVAIAVRLAEDVAFRAEVSEAIARGLAILAAGRHAGARASSGGRVPNGAGHGGACRRERLNAAMADPRLAAIAQRLAARDAAAGCALADALLTDPGLTPVDRISGLVLRARGREMQGDHARAIADLEAALVLDPRQAWLWNELGLACSDAGRPGPALAAFEQATRADPRHARAWNNLANALRAAGRIEDAIVACRSAVQADPGYALAWANLGALNRESGAESDAETALRHALRLDPDHHAALMTLAGLLRERSDLSAAVELFSRACARYPDDTHAALQLAGARAECDQLAGAREAYGIALDRDPGSLRALFGRELTLPMVPADAAAVAAARSRYLEGLAVVAREAPRRATALSAEKLLDELRWTNFLLAYQGQDDRVPQAGYARVVADLVDRGAPQWRAPAARVRDRARIKVGFASAFFRDGTVGRYFERWITDLPREEFEVVVYHLYPRTDGLAQRLAARADLFRHCAWWRPSRLAPVIRDDALDVLIYPELGMGDVTAALAALRLAPLQCAGWGHPATTGHDTIDAFLSVAAMEPGDAQQHYSERLVLLPGIGTRYAAPRIPPAPSRPDTGLPAEGPLLLCPQSLFKIHPDNDALFARVLGAIPGATLVLFEGRDPGLTARFHARLAAAGITAGRIAMLPQRSHEDFLRIMCACDVMLDTLHWSGGNTSLDALACALPIVTLPGRFMRGRQSAGMLRLIGCDELIADDADAYVDIVRRIAGDGAARAAVAAKLRTGRDLLFDDCAPIAALAEFLKAG